MRRLRERLSLRSSSSGVTPDPLLGLEEDGNHRPMVAVGAAAASTAVRSCGDRTSANSMAALLTLGRTLLPIVVAVTVVSCYLSAFVYIQGRGDQMSYEAVVMANHNATALATATATAAASSAAQRTLQSAANSDKNAKANKRSSATKSRTTTSTLRILNHDDMVRLKDTTSTTADFVDEDGDDRYEKDNRGHRHRRHPDWWRIALFYLLIRYWMRSSSSASSSPSLSAPTTTTISNTTGRHVPLGHDEFLDSNSNNVPPSRAWTDAATTGISASLPSILESIRPSTSHNYNPSAILPSSSSIVGAYRSALPLHSQQQQATALAPPPYRDFTATGNNGSDNARTVSPECGVCWNVCRSDEIVRTMPHCDHVFHQACLDRWLPPSDTSHEAVLACPFCDYQV